MNNSYFGENINTNASYRGDSASTNMYFNPMPAATVAPVAPVAPAAPGRRAATQPQYVLQSLAQWDASGPAGHRVPSLYLPYELGASLQANAMAAFVAPPVMGPPTTELPLHHPVPQYPIPRQIYQGPVDEMGQGAQAPRRGALVVTAGGSPVRTRYPTVPRKTARPPYFYPPNMDVFSIAGIPIFEDEDGEKREQEKENDEDQAANTLGSDFGNLRGGGNSDNGYGDLGTRTRAAANCVGSATLFTHDSSEPVVPPYSPLSDADTGLRDRPASLSPDYNFWLHSSAYADSTPEAGASSTTSFESLPEIPGPDLELCRATYEAPTEIQSSPAASLGCSPDLIATSNSLAELDDSSPKLMTTAGSSSSAVDLTSVMSGGDSLMGDAQADIAQGQPSSEPSFNELAKSFLEIFSDRFPQMMYVSGETGEPSVETTGIIEDIVRQQVVEIVSTTNTFADAEQS